MHGREGECIYNFGGKPEGKTPLGRPICRGEDDVKMDWVMQNGLICIKRVTNEGLL
jgi:hypothetical protein